VAGDALQHQIRNWLSPPDPWKNHNIACRSRHSGTAAWFVQSDMFSQWKSSTSSTLLFVHGKRQLPPYRYTFSDSDCFPPIAGAGKSVLWYAYFSIFWYQGLTVLSSSTIIEEIEAMRKSGLASLAMFYYDFREDRKRDLQGLLSSVLFQLCDQSDSYHDILSTFYSTHRRGAQTPGDDQLVQCLKDLLELPGQAPVFLIIDALDECPNTSALSSPRDSVLMFVEDLIEAQLPNLRICVTSRPEPDIRVILEPLTFHSISIHDERGQIEDIEKYIKSAVNTNRKMRKWKPEYKQLVIDTLTKRADGM